MQLHHYQELAVRHLHEHDRAALFMQMGLGKTATTLSALTDEHLPALVVAPKRVTEYVWPAESAIWRPDLVIASATGGPAARARALASTTADLVLISRDNLADATTKPLLGKFNTVILDELSSFKNLNRRWRAARKITKHAKYVWGLTGTPVPNGLLGLWSQIFLLDQGERLGTTLGGFRGRYFTEGLRIANGQVVEWIPLPETQDKIETLLSDICLAMRTEDWLELPPVTFNEVVVPLDTKTVRAYKEMKKTLVAEVDGVYHTAKDAAAALGRLMQICAGFMYADPDEPGPPTVFHLNKIRAAEEIVEGTGSPVLIFYRYKWEREQLQKAMPQARGIDDPGVMADWDQGRVPVLLAHPQSAGHGLNLQKGGHTVIWSTLPLDLEEFDQGNSRVARQGQQNPVVIHLLMSPHTVDPLNLLRLHGKITLQDLVMMSLR